MSRGGDGRVTLKIDGRDGGGAFLELKSVNCSRKEEGGMRNEE